MVVSSWTPRTSGFEESKLVVETVGDGMTCNPYGYSYCLVFLVVEASTIGKSQSELFKELFEVL